MIPIPQEKDTLAIRKDLFLCPLKEKVHQFEQLRYAGCWIGEIEDGILKPSPEYVDILSQSSKNRVVVNEKGEWLFLCGRDLLAESIISMESDDDLVFVFNRYGENIGLGCRKAKTIKNLTDKGIYLRMEKKKKKR